MSDERLYEVIGGDGRRLTRVEVADGVKNGEIPRDVMVLESGTGVRYMAGTFAPGEGRDAEVPVEAVKVDREKKVPWVMILVAAVVIVGLPFLMTGLKNEGDRRVRETMPDRVASHLGEVGAAALIYAADYDDTMLIGFSGGNRWKSDLSPYLMNWELLEPLPGRFIQPNPQIEGVTLSDVALPAETVMFYFEAPEMDGQVGIAYVDGSVEMIDEMDLAGKLAVDPLTGMVGSGPATLGR